MEKIKKAVGEQLVDIETAIVDALSIKEVKLYDLLSLQQSRILSSI